MVTIDIYRNSSSSCLTAPSSTSYN